MKLFLLLTISFFCLILSNVYENLLSWGIKNKLVISPKITMNYKNEDKKEYIAKKLIVEGEELFTIPNSIMLNINKALKEFNSTKILSLYEKYQSYNLAYQKIKNKKDFRIEQSFLSYLIYLVHRYPKKYKKNPFYNYFQYFFESFETNMDSFPLFYSPEQLSLFQNTSFGSVINLASLMYHQEVDILEKQILNKSIIYEDYLRYRIFSLSKSYNVSGMSTMVPFIDFIPRSHFAFNVNFTIGKNKIKIFATKNIYPEEKLVMKAPKTPNINNLLVTGDTYEEMIDFVPSFSIIAISPFLIEDLGINATTIENSLLNLRIELTKEKFYEDAIEIYKKFSIEIGNDGSDLSAYKLFLRNLELSRDNYNKLTSSLIHKIFFQKKDAINAQRILKGETNLLDNRINIMKDVIHQIETKGSNKKNKKKDKIKSYKKNINVEL